MNHYNEVDYSLIACVLLGLLLLAVVLKTLSVTIAKSAIPAGYRSAVVNVLGLSFTLVEIPAQQRLDYLKRCVKLSASDGFEFMRDDLIVSTELIALHLRRWYVPRGVIAFRLRRLTAATIAELFRSCVTLSNLPFSIVKDDDVDDGLQRSDPSLESSDDDEWDWVDGEDEKKKRPVALQ
jgi:hypothetical protein